VKQGDLVKYDHPSNPMLGLVKSVKPDRTWGKISVLVQWCNNSNTEECVWQEDLKVVSGQ
jgi:hypothetical protein